MASKVFITAINEIMTAYFVTPGNDIKCKLCMSNNTCATDALDGSVQYLTDVSDLDECDATGYADTTLTTPSNAVDDANDRAEFDDSGAASVVFSGLGGDGTRDYSGVLLYREGGDTGTATDDECIAWLEFGSAVSKESTSVTVTWNAEGIIQGANA